MMTIEPVVLEGRYVRLEPLSLNQLDQICEVGLEPSIWRYMPVVVKTPDNMRKLIENLLKAQEQGTALPFTTFERASGQAIGNTRYLNIDRANHRVEIGGTWVAPQWQRTPMNTEAKYLMMRHAFEVLGCIRVELKTDALNEKSRNAILRIGAKQEGILRQHMIMPDGRLRDSVYFSVLDSEWPEVKANLEEKLARPYTPKETA